MRPSTRIKLAVAVLVTTASAGLGASWHWLTQRPLTVDARAEHSSPSEPVAPPEEATLEADTVDLEAPLELPPDAILPVATERARSPSFRNTENYLFVGVDRTRGRTFGRADAIMLAVFDDDSGHVGFVSIPRDLYVDVPGHGPARINATLRIARRIEADPLTLVRRVASDALAVPVHHVLVVDLERFERSIDRLGGIDVLVECPIIDNFIDPRTESGRRLLSLDAGRQHLDGATAAMYARSRHGRSDWDRARRQQAILFGLRDRVRALGTTEWIPIVLEAIEEGVITTMSRLEMLQLARRGAAIEREHMHGLVIGTRQTESFRTTEGRWVLMPDYDAIDRHLRTLFGAPAPGTRPEHKACPAADVAVTRARSHSDDGRDAAGASAP